MPQNGSSITIAGLCLIAASIMPATADNRIKFAQTCTIARTWTEAFTCPKGTVKYVTCRQCAVPPGASGEGTKNCDTKFCINGE